MLGTPTDAQRPFKRTAAKIAPRLGPCQSRRWLGPVPLTLGLIFGDEDKTGIVGRLHRGVFGVFKDERVDDIALEEVEIGNEPPLWFV